MKEIKIYSIDEIKDKFGSIGDMLERKGYDVVRISLKEEVLGGKKVTVDDGRDDIIKY